MKRNTGFSLHEILAVFIVVGILVYFGVTVVNAASKEARLDATVTKIRTQLQDVQKGFDFWTNKYGEDPVWGYPAYREDFVEEGFLQEFPVPDTEWAKDSECVSHYSPIGERGYYAVRRESVGGSEEKDAIVSLNCISEELCAHFNKTYSLLGETIPKSSSVITKAGGMMCYGDNGGGNDYTIIAVLDLD